MFADRTRTETRLVRVRAGKLCCKRGAQDVSPLVATTSVFCPMHCASCAAMPTVSQSCNFSGFFCHFFNAGVHHKVSTPCCI